MRVQYNKLSSQLMETTSKSVATVSTQTDTCLMVNKHTQVKLVDRKAVQTKTISSEESKNQNKSTIRNIKEIPKPIQKINISGDKSERRMGPKLSPGLQRKTLIIGSSILQRINTRGLSRNTAVKTYRGANVSHIRQYLEKSNLSSIENFIIQVGGNDASQNRDYELVECGFDNIIRIIKKNNQNAKVYLSECPPRRDVNVGWVNDIIRRVADEIAEYNGKRKHRLQVKMEEFI